MKSVIFSFTTHNHQPIGNFDWVLDHAYEHSYKPFFEVAGKYPSVRIGTHFSGYLLKWLVEKHPEFRPTLRKLVAGGQLELLTGGFYEPMLSVIPEWDQQIQIRRLTSVIETEFGYAAKGLWLAERVWNQALASVLHDAGVRYVALDDTHFLGAGLNLSDLNGYYLTEDRGKVLSIFPISKELRYTIPFAPVDETIRILRDSASDSGTSIVFFGDDGEKFGEWPDTYRFVYDGGWLDELFRKLDENRSWIRTLHGSEILKTVKPKGRIYLPNCSYAEMMQWSLPTAEASQSFEEFQRRIAADERLSPFAKFAHGGFWPNFFVKYPESNHLHKRVADVSERLVEMKRLSSVGQHGLEQAEEHLLAAECNDAYWHGIFGGIYLNNIRHAVFTELLCAERSLDESSGERVRIVEKDFDCDGAREVFISTGVLSFILSPEHGGMLIELDYMPKVFNALNLMNRRREAYHSKLKKAHAPGAEGSSKSIHDQVLAKEEGLERHLVYDWYRHGAFQEHFFEPGETFESFSAMSFKERGDFLEAPFVYRVDPETAGIHVHLERLGILFVGGRACQVRLRKSLDVLTGKGDAKVTYLIENVCPETLLFKFGSEWACNFLAGNAPDRYYSADAKKLEPPELEVGGPVTGVTEFRIVDEWMKLAFVIQCDAPTEFWRVPIETVSLSEAGFERVYQGSIVMPVWTVQLAPQETWTQTFSVRFEELS